jgi:hypothetical protein
MLLTQLEGTVVEGKEGIEIYKSYINSYTCVFQLITWSCLNTPVHKVYSLGSNKSMGSDFTLLDSYKDYVSRGRLYELTTQFRKYDSRVPAEEFLSDLLKDKGYDLILLVDSLVEKFTDAYMEEIKFILNQSNTKAIISKCYNIPVIKTEKIKFKLNSSVGL